MDYPGNVVRPLELPAPRGVGGAEQSRAEQSSHLELELELELEYVEEFRVST